MPRKREGPVATPCRAVNRLPWTSEPDQVSASKSKKPRVAAEVWKEVTKEGETQEDREAEDPMASREDASHEDWNLDRRVAALKEMWATPSETAQSPDAPLMFRTLARALGSGVNAAKELALVFRQVLHSNELQAMLRLLLVHGPANKALRTNLVAAIAEVFSLREIGSGDARSLTARDLAHAAQSGRQRQKQLFMPKALTMLEVDAFVSEHEILSSPTRGQKEMQKMLGRSSAEGQETWHLVLLLQGVLPLSQTAMLRALAQGLWFQHRNVDEDTLEWQKLAEMEASVVRAYGECGGDVAHFAALISRADVFEALQRHGPSLGRLVLPMRPQAASQISEALEALEDSSIWADWSMDGERVQIHASEASGLPEELRVFNGRGELCSSAKTSEVSAAMLSGKLAAARCILEAVLVRVPIRRAPKGKASENDSSSAEKRLPAKDDAEASLPSGDAEEVETPEAEAEEAPEAPLTVALFDVLQVGDVSMTRKSLSERRAALQALVTEGPRIRIVPGQELPANEAAVKAELNRAISAINTASKEDKGISKARGLILKRMTGPASEYFSGRYSEAWQVVTKARATGAEAERLLFETCLSEDERPFIPSSEELHICIISARRAQTADGRRGVLAVERQFVDAGVKPMWYVDEASLEDYLALGLDAKVGGKLIPARNLALQDASELGKACVQCSDDISRWDYYQSEEARPKKGKGLQEANSAAKRAERYAITPVAAARFILAKMRATPEEKPQLGGVYPLTNLGLSINSDAFTRNNFILGDFFVVDKSSCRFDDSMTLKEDYDFTCSHLKAHGSVMRCNRLFIHAKHETNSGGAVSERDVGGVKERANISILQSKWPGAFLKHHTRPNQVILRWECYDESKRGASEQQIQ